MLFFASPIGLGHATRDIAIAEQLAMPKSDVLFISGEGAPWLIEKKGFQCIDAYRPEKFRVENGQLQQSFQWLMAYYSYYKKCKAISRGILTERAGLVVSDEDFASAAVAEEMGRKRVLITDITESHFTKGAASLIEKRMNGALKKIMAKCDCVIMPDKGDDRGNVVHVGPIVRSTSADRDSLRQQLNFTKNTIVVSIGGTDAGRFLIEKVVKAYKKLRSRLDADLVVVPGPALQLPDSSDYRNMGFAENLHEIIFAADLVVSLAGRSTMDESMAYGTPGIFIPIKGHFEQEEGAKRMGYKYDDIFRLESLMEENLGRRASRTDMSGAQKAAEVICNMASNQQYC